MNNLRYTIELDVKGKLLPELKITRQSFDQVTAAAKKTSGQFQKLTNICDKLTSINFSAIVDNVQNVFDSLSNLGGSGTDFQQGMADLQAITGIVGKDFEAVAEAARRVGKESGLGARGAVDAFTLLASQINIDSIGLEGLMQLQRETITLAQAGGLSLADAATAMAATINQFGLQANQANRVVNVLAAGSRMGAAEVQDLANSFRITGATAAAAGLSVEQTAGALEVLSASNIKGSEADTALRNVILKLQTTLGMDLSQTGLAAALDALKPKLDDVSYLAKVFGAENIAAAQYLITNAEAVREMTDAVTGTNAAQEQAAIRTNTVAEQMKLIQANIDDLKITLFEATNGWVGYASALGNTAVMVSQSLPLLSMLKGVIVKMASIAGGVAVFSWIKLAAAVKGASAAIRANALTIQFMAGIFATLPARIMAFVKALTLQRAATIAVTAAQKLLNIALWANPVGIVVAAITTLTAGLVMAYKHCDRFRELVNRWAEGFKGLTEWIGKAWEKIKQFFGFGEQMEDISDSSQETVDAMQKLSQSLGNTGGVALLGGNKNTDLNTLGGLTNKINELKEAQEKASLSNAIGLQKEIDLYQKRLDYLRMTIGTAGHLKDNNYKEELQAPSMTGVEVPALTIPVLFDMEVLQANFQKLKEMFQKNWTEITVMSEKQIEGLLTQSFASLGEAIGSGNALEALKSSLMMVMDMLQQFGSALIAAGVASEALKAVAWSGIGAIIAGGALVAATAAAKAALNKATAFANGGIVSGPTLALVGEYGGARNNPEVIAPLDKLRSLIQPAGFNTDGLYLETKVRGKDLYVALQSVEHGRRRTR